MTLGALPFFGQDHDIWQGNSTCKISKLLVFKYHTKRLKDPVTQFFYGFIS
jgi:hypothetical protein